MAKLFFRAWLLGLRFLYFLALIATFAIVLFCIMTIVRGVFRPTSFSGFITGITWVVPFGLSVLMFNSAIGFLQFLKKAYAEETGAGSVFGPMMYLLWLSILPFLSIFSLILLEVEYLPKVCRGVVYLATLVFIVTGMKKREP